MPDPVLGTGDWEVKKIGKSAHPQGAFLLVAETVGNYIRQSAHAKGC